MGARRDGWLFCHPSLTQTVPVAPRRTHPGVLSTTPLPSSYTPRYRWLLLCSSVPLLCTSPLIHSLVPTLSSPFSFDPFSGTYSLLSVLFLMHARLFASLSLYLARTHSWRQWIHGMMDATFIVESAVVNGSFEDVLTYRRVLQVRQKREYL